MASAFRSRVAAALDSDLFYSFWRSKLVVAAAILTALLVGAALLAPVIAPHDPYDLKSLELINADLPPAWDARGDRRFLLGTDDQGRDILSTILYGTRASLLIGIASVLLAVTLGVTLGLWAGYAGGRIDSVIMRIADVQLTFPAILTALLIDGVALAIFKTYRIDGGKFWILVLSIGLAYWVQYARTVRGVTLVERNKEYVEAARLIVEFQHYMAARIEERRAAPKDDILSDLISARLDGEAPLGIERGGAADGAMTLLAGSGMNSTGCAISIGAISSRSTITRRPKSVTANRCSACQAESSWLSTRKPPSSACAFRMASQV